MDNSLKLKKLKIVFQLRKKGSLHFRKKHFHTGKSRTNKN
ncbi:adrenodoxin reductase [Listeria innocua FSL J1-023]|nr:adrenodoxin reductase [Listeria innocua FSL J1-023]